MRKLRLTLFLLGIFAFVISCQQGFDSDLSLETNQKSISELKTRTNPNAKQVFMPLDSIPECVRENTTPEEYELWKVMSTRYQINYSFIDMNLRDDQRADLYNTLKIICKKIEEGSLGQGDLGYFVVQTMKRNNINSIEKLSMPESGEVARDSYPEVIYKADNANEACVRVIVSFYTNSEGTEISRVTGARAYADGYDAVKYEGSCSTGNFGPVILNVSCSGTLTYKNKTTGTISDTFNKSLNIKVLPG